MEKCPLCGKPLGNWQSPHQCSVAGPSGAPEQKKEQIKDPAVLTFEKTTIEEIADKYEKGDKPFGKKFIDSLKKWWIENFEPPKEDPPAAGGAAGA